MTKVHRYKIRPWQTVRIFRTRPPKNTITKTNRFDNTSLWPVWFDTSLDFLHKFDWFWCLISTQIWLILMHTQIWHMSLTHNFYTNLTLVWHLISAQTWHEFDAWFLHKLDWFWRRGPQAPTSSWVRLADDTFASARWPSQIRATRTSFEPQFPTQPPKEMRRNEKNI